MRIEIISLSPNIDLKSELSTTFELGFSNKFNCGDNKFQLDISIFENNFDNENSINLVLQVDTRTKWLSVIECISDAGFDDYTFAKTKEKLNISFGY